MTKPLTRYKTLVSLKAWYPDNIYYPQIVDLYNLEHTSNVKVWRNSSIEVKFNPDKPIIKLLNSPIYEDDIWEFAPSYELYKNSKKLMMIGEYQFVFWTKNDRWRVRIYDGEWHHSTLDKINYRYVKMFITDDYYQSNNAFISKSPMQEELKNVKFF